MVKMFVEPTQERDRCCTLLTKLESSLATLYKIIFTKFSNKYLKRRSSMSPDFLKLHIHFQKKKYPDKIVSKFKRQFVMSVILFRQMLNWIWNSGNLCSSWTGKNIPLLYNIQFISLFLSPDFWGLQI